MKLIDMKNLIHRKKPVSIPTSNHSINVYRDWKIVLIATFIVGLILIAWSLYLLEQIRNDEFLKVELATSSTRGAVNEKKLEAVSSIFLDKAKKHDVLSNTPLPISDPSR
jgi:hypothetical protein